MLGERLAGAAVSHRDIAWSGESGRNVLAEFLEYDRGNRFVGEYMTKVDGATMFHSLEARSPFLDQDLWEYAASLSFELRLKGGRLKAVLRELARQKLGEQVASGRKRGFSIPVQRWLVGRWQTALTELLRTSILDQQGWINSRAVLDRLKVGAEKGWAPNQLWYIFVLESWLRHEQNARSEADSFDKREVRRTGGHGGPPLQRCASERLVGAALRGRPYVGFTDLNE